MAEDDNESTPLTTLETTVDQVVAQALRVAYEVDRWNWLCGNKPFPVPPMLVRPVPSRSGPTKEAAQSTASRSKPAVDRAIPILHEQYSLTEIGSVKLEAAYAKVVEVLAGQGKPAVSCDSVRRALARIRAG